MTRVTVVDPDAGSGRKAAEESPSGTPGTDLDLETAVVNLVTQDPFITIKEINTELRYRPGSLNPSWWRIFKILRVRKLLTRRSRFRYIFGRR